MRKFGKHRGEAQALNNLAIAAAAMGRHREAVAHVTESADLLRSVDGDPDVLCSSLGSLALSLSHLGEHDRAQAAVAEVLALAERIGARRTLAETLNVSGQAATQRGDFAEAEALFCQARQLACEIDAHIEQTESAVCLGANRLLQGDPVAALEFLEQAEELTDGQERNRWKVRIAQHKGDAYLALGDMAQADAYFTRALAWPESSYVVAKGRAAYGLARIALAEDPPDRHTARERLREALRILDETELDSLKQTVSAALAEAEAEAEAD
jgi:tetratricopeptide (TPR) repeat protein